VKASGFAMIDPKDRDSLIAYLEDCANRSAGAHLPTDLAVLLVEAMNAMSDEQGQDISSAAESYVFCIDARGRDGVFKTNLGGSDDERIARKMFSEAVRQLPSRRITLSRGADVLEDSWCNKAA
jgi:hypothetical protein